MYCSVSFFTLPLQLRHFTVIFEMSINTSVSLLRKKVKSGNKKNIY